jgi:hypothetical protein
VYGDLAFIDFCDNLSGTGLVIDLAAGGNQRRSHNYRDATRPHREKVTHVPRSICNMRRIIIVLIFFPPSDG